jgi:hypothetical protein
MAVVNVLPWVYRQLKLSRTIQTALTSALTQSSGEVAVTEPEHLTFVGLVALRPMGLRAVMPRNFQILKVERLVSEAA